MPCLSLAMEIVSSTHSQTNCTEALTATLKSESVWSSICGTMRTISEISPQMLGESVELPGGAPLKLPVLRIPM
ncbi:hypothetical protein I7I51_08065 [Histoplasma capsulatum]|uniref:Uncharacterized protein n=1 Tax=Ajellomyces capsulatus TaxID=5037 RepID=A0A8A1M388_AJECA|nr:hypothetical protein I7I51_08065 [Histoplasma capsulatum]